MRNEALWVSVMLVVGCGPAPVDTPGRFGEVTSAVVIVNPVINQGSTTSVTTGAVRSGVTFQAADLPESETDETGLALVEGLPTGSVPLAFPDGTVSLQVIQEQELYDVVVAVRDGAVQHVIDPVRYPIGGETRILEEGASISEAVGSDSAIILLAPGTYRGDFEITSEGVLIFGAWSPEEGPLSIIEGNVTVRGGGVRMRGVKVTGKVTSAANNFSLSFSDIGSASITGNGVSLIRNRFTAGSATVPSSSSVLVDNVGIP